MQENYSIEWLLKKSEEGEHLKYLFFWGHENKHKEKIGKFCLSQWFESPFIVNEVLYPTAEHWMMAQKARLFGDITVYHEIMGCRHPGEAKEWGRKVRGYDEHHWSRYRWDIVRAGNIHKFNQHPELCAYLLATENRILVEASPMDRIWGIGLAQSSPDIDHISAWRGLNLLGFVLMSVRDFMREFGHFHAPENIPQTPWEQFPHAPSTDLFWRMGKGEACLSLFHQYYHSLPHREKNLIPLFHPAPQGWDDFYA